MERGVSDAAASHCVEQRGFADAGSAHEHDDEQGLIRFEGFGLAAEVGGHGLQRRA
jgi:hypothetical protein